MLPAGSLNQRIMLQDVEVTKNSIGEQVPTFKDMLGKPLPAAVKFQKGNRALTFGDVWNPTTVIFTIRYYAQWLKAKRVVWNDNIYIILSANPDTANGSITITAELYNDGQDITEQ